MKGRAKLCRRAFACAVAAACVGGTASAADAASLSVSVKPKNSHPGGHYSITVKGKVRHGQLKNHPFLIAWIQYSSQSCGSTAQKEFNRLKSAPYIQDTITATTFKVVRGFVVGSPGTRRICAYLYSHYIQPTSSASPIARASAKEIVT